MVRWHHQLNGITNLMEFEEASGVGDGQGSLACCSPWGCKESNTTEWLNWIETSPSHQDVIRIIRWQNLVLLGSKAEKAVATQSSTLAWKIPWTEEPGRLQSMGSLRVGWLSDFTFTFHLRALEEEMATHSSVLAWRIPGTGEPGGLPSMGLHWSYLAAAAGSKELCKPKIV